MYACICDWSNVTYNESLNDCCSVWIRQSVHAAANVHVCVCMHVYVTGQMSHIMSASTTDVQQDMHVYAHTYMYLYTFPIHICTE